MEPTPHSTPTATSHTTARALPWAASAGFPAPAKAVHTVVQTRWPTCTSAAAAVGAAASARNAFERHSKAATWIALRADVVGGWGDGTEKESSVGWMSARSGSRSVGRNEGACAAGVFVVLRGVVEGHRLVWCLVHGVIVGFVILEGLGLDLLVVHARPEVWVWKRRTDAGEYF
jgi:hypothetical protein